MNYRKVFHMIGQILKVEAALLALPLLVAVIYREHTALWAFLLPMALLLITGFLLTWKKTDNRTFGAKEGFLTVSLTWVFLSLFGAMPFILSGYIPNVVDALFETVSGFTTTGASILTDIEVLPQSLLFWRSFTHWVGGMGILVFVLAILPQTDTHSMYLLRAEVPGPSVGKLVSRTKLTARILYGIYIVLTLLEIIMLWAGGMPLFDSIVNTFSTAGTGGFAIKNTSVAFYNSAYIDIVITVFMALFGVNFTLFYFILIGRVKDALRSEELHWYLAIMLGSIGIISVNILPLYKSFGTALRHAAFQVSSVMTTTGFATQDFNKWPDLSRCILVLVMFVGACAGSTGGGIKVSRVLMLVKSSIRSMRRMLSPRSVISVKLEGVTIEPQTLSEATSYFVAYMLVFAFSVLLLTLDKFDLVTSFTAVAACLNNVGPGLEVVGPIGNYSGFTAFSKIILIFNMLAGRLEIFPVLMLFSPHAWKK